jgi:hypothetical protein
MASLTYKLNRCLIAELFLDMRERKNEHLFSGGGVGQTKTKILQICGTPSNAELREFPITDTGAGKPRTLNRKFMKSGTPLAPGLAEFIDLLLQWVPKRRMAAAKACRHPFFTKQDPRPERFR